jgi:hypothetical protein
MTDINWGLLGRPIDMAGVVNQGFQHGQQMGRRRAVEQALDTLARDGSNVDALANLTALAPEEAYRFQAAGRASNDYARGERYRSALANYMAPGRAPAPNALAVQPAQNALGPTPGRTQAPGAEGPQSTRTQMVPGTLDALAPPSQADEIVVQGRRPVPMPPAPRAPGGDGWADVVAADPIKAMEASHDIWGSREDHLKDWQHVSTAAMRLMAGVHDQAGYDRGKETARHLYESYGVPFPDNLPDQYSPDVIRDLQMQQLDAEDQVRAALSEKKFEWQRQDDLLDNQRQDRDTNSRITDRDQRRGLTVRGQNLTDARGRYATGVASADRRRGQDMAQATAIRGQDHTDARGRGRRRAGAAAAPAPTGPTPGEVIGGYRFKGGDPANRANWAKAN